MSTLAETAVLPTASLTRHVDKLVERGLVVRRIHSDDKRRVVTALSPVGTTVAERCAPRSAVSSAIAAELGDDRLQVSPAGFAGSNARSERPLGPSGRSTDVPDGNTRRSESATPP